MACDLSAAADAIRSAHSILIVTHIDADGISAGAIAYMTVGRLGKERRIVFEKKITDETIAMVDSAPEDIVWICDLGSGYLSEFTRPGIVVTDHHVPDPKWRRKQTVLDDSPRSTTSIPTATAWTVPTRFAVRG